MIPIADLKTMSRAHLLDAEALFRNYRCEGAVYICGYAIEFALKARICRTLRWPEFPDTRGEFEAYQSFKTHNLIVLLHLSGVEDKVKAAYGTEWETVKDWSPEQRYKRTGNTTREQAKEMISAARVLLRYL